MSLKGYPLWTHGFLSLFLGLQVRLLKLLMNISMVRTLMNGDTDPRYFKSVDPPEIENRRTRDVDLGGF